MSWGATAVDQTGAELTDRFQEFYQTYYSDDIAHLAQHYPREQRSLSIEYADLFQFDPDLADDWIDQPARIRDYAEEALADYDLPADVDLGDPGVNVRLNDSHDSLRTVGVPGVDTSRIGKYVAVRGQLAQVTGIKPRIKTAVWICNACGANISVTQPRNSVTKPDQCDACERTKFSLSQEQTEFVDHRKIKIEEPPGERANGRGQSIVGYVDEDLCHYGGENGLSDRAGEHVTVFGQIRIDASDLDKPSAKPETTSWLDVHAIEFSREDHADVDVAPYRDEFERIAAQDDAIDQVAASIAPELDRDDDLAVITEASVAWLFNSYRADPDGMGSYRGDLHMAVIGDPGLGKSTLMSSLAEIAPKCEYRSGTGLSAVGLTAAAIQEEFAGTTEWTLQPGVLPRANGGHCIIDEVDDVVDDQTKKIHDALEGDQMVKVDKANITADLPTRTALLASGNPVHGRFDRHEPIAEQVDLDPALVSRFDLLFTMQDVVDRETDQRKADHILDAYDETSRAAAAEKASQDVETPSDDAVTHRAVSVDTLRAWIVYARENVFPVMTDGAKRRLAEFYTEARDLNDGYNSDDDDETAPVTPRTLEAGIRISTAFARVELSDTVEHRHVERAIRISRAVIGVNYDPETGEFDAGRTDEGGQKSMDQRRRAFMAIVRDHPDGIFVDELKDELASSGWSLERLDGDIDHFRELGAIRIDRSGESDTVIPTN